VLSEFRKLSQPPRQFLVFSALNLFTWFSIGGPVMVLFARHIEMPASWIGVLNSFLQLATLLVIVTIPLVLKLGSKRLLLITWSLQSVAASLLFLVPWALNAYGAHVGWCVMLAAVLGFCLVRATGIGGWFPLIHAVVPKGEQGPFFSTEMALLQGCTVTATLVQAFILGSDPTIGRFLFINAFGIASGVLSALWLKRIPVVEQPHTPIKGSGSLEAYAAALKDKGYLLFVFTTVICFSGFAWINTSIVLYMRDAMKFSDMNIMIFLAAGNFGVLLTIAFWGRFAEHSGSGYAGLLAMLGHSIGAIVYLFLPPGAPWSAWLLPPTLVCTTLLGAAYWTINHRYMISLVDKEHKVGYTNLWIVGTALSMGVTPVITGYIIEHYGMLGFRASFAISGFGGILAGLANFWAVHNRRPLRHALDELVNPMLPLRTVGRIAWVTVGLHSSNRRGESGVWRGESGGRSPEAVAQSKIRD
jgi:Na+/melibiose symporter-like transporter